MQWEFIQHMLFSLIAHYLLAELWFDEELLLVRLETGM